MQQAVTDFSQHRMTLVISFPLSAEEKSTINQFLVCTHACLSTVGVWIANREGESSKTRAEAGKPLREMEACICSGYSCCVCGSDSFLKGEAFLKLYTNKI